MVLTMAGSVVVLTSLRYSKSSGSYKILGPLSKHCRTFVEKVFKPERPDEAISDTALAIELNIPEIVWVIV